MEPPQSEAELIRRLDALRGSSLTRVSEHKGAAGQAVEKALGATAGPRAEPDFPALGIELKTIPVDASGCPLESCFVASRDLARADLRWEDSPVRKKLARVAWVTMCGDRVERAFLWSPSAEQEQALRDDYEDIVDLLGEGMRVDARVGKILQLRPKGRNAAHLRWALDHEGARTRMPPRAFYLRRTFTAGLLAALP